VQTNLSPAVTTLVDDLGDEICDAEQNEQGGDPEVPGDETAQIPAIPADYTLSATASADAESVLFWVSEGDSGDWRLVGTDRSGPPWTTVWVPGLVDNDPAARVNRYWITTTSGDISGNLESIDRNADGALDTLDAQVDVTVTDCVAPVVNITRVENGVGVTDDDLTDGATVPNSDAINIWVDATSVPGYTGFSDRDEIFIVGAGPDVLPGAATVDDDGDGSIDELDFGPDGIMAGGLDGLDNNGDGVVDDAAEFDDEWGFGDDQVAGYVPRAGLGLDRAPGNVDQPSVPFDGDEDGDGTADELDYGPDGVPGTADDEFFQTTDPTVLPDDYFTNDVIRVDFQYRPAAGGGPWLPIPGSSSLTGTIVNGVVSDLVPPLKITWDVTTLPPGDYDIRAQGFDVEGNTNDGTAFITTIHVDNVGLRAYVTPPIQEAADAPGVFQLYAHTYIHDNFIDHVEFQFSTDDGASWNSIGVDDNDDAGADPGGDVLMRAGSDPFQTSSGDDVVGASYGSFGALDGYADLDNDGYSPRDPIILDDGSSAGEYDADDTLLLGDAPPIGSPIVYFDADDIFFADVDGNGSWSVGEWIYLDNPGGNSDNDDFDLWTVTWDARGLDGDVLVRAVATNEIGVTDSDGIPFEEVTIDVDAPCAEISGITLQNGTFVSPNYDSLDVFPENSFIQIRATVADSDIDSGRRTAEPTGSVRATTST
jgi:hypothetical protein